MPNLPELILPPSTYITNKKRLQKKYNSIYLYEYKPEGTRYEKCMIL